jgi:hypothetical protein
VRHLTCLLDAAAAVLPLAAAGVCLERPALATAWLGAAGACWLARCVLTALRPA